MLNDPQRIDTDEGTVKRKAKGKQAQTNAILKRKAKGTDQRSFKNLKHVDIVSFNAGSEDRFVELVRKLIEENGEKGTLYAQVIQEAAYELGVSTQTAKRYMTKHSARRAEFRVFADRVILNPNYVPADEDDE